LISINYRDSRPIYQQLKDSIRVLVLTGTIAPEEKLPSVRDLAAELAINPNTIQRAYRELEAEGLLYSVPGKGSFASATDTVADSHIRDLKAELRATAEKLHRLGVPAVQLEQCIKEVYDHA